MPEVFSESGLRAEDIHAMVEAARALPAVHQLILFGSRAKGNYKSGSDVDLAIKGKAIQYETAVQLAGFLNEESLMPYFFDVVNYHSISEPKLIEHIDRMGVVLFDRDGEGFMEGRV